MDLSPEILEMLRRNSGLGLNRDGQWHIRGEAITHERILDTLNRGLDVRDDGEVIVSVGDQWAYVEFEDTAFVVRNILPTPSADGGPPGKIELILNAGFREDLDPATLSRVGIDSLYCEVKGGRARARFLRSAYHNLLPYLMERDGGYAVELASGTYPIREISA